MYPITNTHILKIHYALRQGGLRFQDAGIPAGCSSCCCWWP